MQKTFYKKGEKVDAMSVAGEDMWVYSCYGVKADVFKEGNKAVIPVVISKNQGEGNFKKWLDEMEKEFEKIEFSTIVNVDLATYLAKRGYKPKF